MREKRRRETRRRRETEEGQEGGWRRGKGGKERDKISHHFSY